MTIDEDVVSGEQTLQIIPSKKALLCLDQRDKRDPRGLVLTLARVCAHLDAILHAKVSTDRRDCHHGRISTGALYVAGYCDWLGPWLRGVRGLWMLHLLAGGSSLKGL